MKACDIENRRLIVDVVTQPNIRQHLSEEYGVDIIPLQTKSELRLFFKGFRNNSEPFNAATNIKGLLTPFSGAFESIKTTVYGAELVLYFNDITSRIVNNKIKALSKSKEAWIKKRNLDEQSQLEIEETLSTLNQPVPPIQISTGNEFVVDGEVFPTFEDARNSILKKKEYGPNYLFDSNMTYKEEDSLPLSDSNSDFSIPCIIK